MFSFIDTHAHLYDQQYSGNLPEVIARAQEAGVVRVYLPNLNLGTITPMLDLVAEYPHFFRPMLGLHPCDVKENAAAVLATMEKKLADHTFAAIGEVGIDLYRDTTYQEAQISALHRAIDWALACDLPLVLHARNALDPLIDVIKGRQNGRLRGVFHCFTGTKAQAEAILGAGFYIGLGGIITFAKSQLPSVVAGIPLNAMLLETDSPYLAPTPFRGRCNEPAHLRLIAEAIARYKESSIADVAATTTANAYTLFGKS